MNLIIAMALCVILVVLVIIVHAQVIRIIRAAQSDSPPIMPRVVAGLFLAHLLEVAIFAIGMLAAVEWFHIGSLLGAENAGFRSYMYFSMETYTSLGMGDIYPVGELRMLAGFEVLTGLLMIGWSASFLFVEMRAAEDRAA